MKVAASLGRRLLHRGTGTQEVTNTGAHKSAISQQLGMQPQVCRPGSREQWAGKLYRQEAAVPAGVFTLHLARRLAISCAAETSIVQEE